VFVYVTTQRKIYDDDCHAGVACGLEVWPEVLFTPYRGASNQQFPVLVALIAENLIPTFINIAHDRSNLQQVELLKDPDRTVGTSNLVSTTSQPRPSNLSDS
jgi:hypothetical protein